MQREIRRENIKSSQEKNRGMITAFQDKNKIKIFIYTVKSVPFQGSYGNEVY